MALAILLAIAGGLALRRLFEAIDKWVDRRRG